MSGYPAKTSARLSDPMPSTMGKKRSQASRDLYHGKSGIPLVKRNGKSRIPVRLSDCSDEGNTDSSTSYSSGISATTSPAPTKETNQTGMNNSSGGHGFRSSTRNDTSTQPKETSKTDSPVVSFNLKASWTSTPEANDRRDMTADANSLRTDDSAVQKETIDPDQPFDIDAANMLWKLGIGTRTESKASVIASKNRYRIPKHLQDKFKELIAETIAVAHARAYCSSTAQVLARVTMVDNSIQVCLPNCVAESINETPGLDPTTRVQPDSTKMVNCAIQVCMRDSKVTVNEEPKGNPPANTAPTGPDCSSTDGPETDATSGLTVPPRTPVTVVNAATSTTADFECNKCRALTTPDLPPIKSPQCSALPSQCSPPTDPHQCSALPNPDLPPIVPPQCSALPTKDVPPTGTSPCEREANQKAPSVDSTETDPVTPTNGKPLVTQSDELEDGEIEVDDQPAPPRVPKKRVKWAEFQRNPSAPAITRVTPEATNIQKKLQAMAKHGESTSYAHAIHAGTRVFTTLMYPRHKEDLETLPGLLRAHIDALKLKGRLVKIRSIQKGFAIDLSDEEDAKNLPDIIAANPTLAERTTARPPKPRTDLIMLHNLDNATNIQKLTDDIAAAIKLAADLVTYKFQLRSKTEGKIHIILEARANKLLSEALHKGLIRVQNKEIRVQTFKPSPRCFRCQILGHHARICSSREPRCSRCAERHETSSCQSSRVRCINCIMHNMEKGSRFNVNHSAAATTCPVYIIATRPGSSQSPTSHSEPMPRTSLTQHKRRHTPKPSPNQGGINPQWRWRAEQIINKEDHWSRTTRTNRSGTQNSEQYRTTSINNSSRTVTWNREGHSSEPTVTVHFANPRNESAGQTSNGVTRVVTRKR